MLDLCAAAAELDIPIALVGGKNEESLSQLIEILEHKYPRLRIVFAHSPPFRDPTAEERASLAGELNASGARLVIIGLGCPKQERWMAANQDRVQGFMIGLGAAFDFNSGNVPLSPAWVHRVGLEWLYRLAREPRRLWRRYLSTSPKFILLLLIDTARSGRSM